MFKGNHTKQLTRILLQHLNKDVITIAHEYVNNDYIISFNASNKGEPHKHLINVSNIGYFKFINDCEFLTYTDGTISMCYYSSHKPQKRFTGFHFHLNYDILCSQKY